MVNQTGNDIQFRIFCGNTDLNNTTLENIKTDTWVNYNGNTQVWYASADKRSDSILKQVDIVKPDILYMVGIFSWHFNIVPFIFSKVATKIISVRGMLHPGALTQKRHKKQLFLKIARMFNLQKNAIFHATDEKEAVYIKNIFGEDIRVTIAGNFPRKLRPSPLLLKEPYKLKLLTIGLISPMKNHLLVLQSLKQCTSGVEYHICGPVKDMEYWQLCLAQIRDLPSNISVHYHGEVQPQSIEEYLAKAHVFILPSKSENFGHAIYEALSAGKPVITSFFTPWQNLETAHAGLNVELSEISIKNGIQVFVAMDETEFRSWRDSAVEYARTIINIEDIKLQYKNVFTVKN
ncbi:MAG: glycosyltransferase [Ferruginibacter sp.]